MKKNPARPAITKLTRHLAFRETFGRPCYIKWTRTHAALIVPHLRDGADGPYSYIQGLYRLTVEEAVALGLVSLGRDRVTVPNYSAGGRLWANVPEHEGRTIALRGEAR